MDLNHKVDIYIISHLNIVCYYPEIEYLYDWLFEWRFQAYPSFKKPEYWIWGYPRETEN